MNAQEFASFIKTNKPSREALTANGLPIDFVNLILTYFELEKKSNNHVDDPIIDLVTNWKLDTLDIQNFHFFNEIEEDSQFLFFGRDAVDHLAISKEQGNIVAYEMISGRIMFQCATSSATFLDAMCEIAKFAAENLAGKFNEDIIDAEACKVAYTAALKAGGEQYGSYFKSVLAIDP